MKKLLIFLVPFFASVIMLAGGSFPQPAIPTDETLELKVKEILSSMSVKDKIGQMCEVTIDVVLKDTEAGGIVEIDESKADSIFGIYRVGSVLNVPNGRAKTPESWYRIISAIQASSMKNISIPDIYGVDQNHGASYTKGATLFPQEINMAATFNRELVREGARICAYESRACDIPWVYNPVMDLGRNPAWSRMWESFGEDPYVNGAMAVEMVKGYQGDNPNDIGPQNVACCLKHYMAYGNPQSGKDRTPANINPLELREKYFYPYKEAIQAGALSVMVNSGIVNGIPFHANREYLTEWLKEDLNWDGVIVSDWSDIHNLWKRDRIAHDYKEAIMIAINAGIDMSMTPYDVEFCTLLEELVEEGKVKMERIDDAAARIIRMKLRLNLFKTPDTNPVDYPLFACDKFAEKSLEMAQQSVVLLKNENNILPLGKNKKILVTGPNANSLRCLNGGWSYTWQGTDINEFHENYNTIFQALADKFGKENVFLEQGMDYMKGHGNWEKEENLRIAKAVEMAKNVDIIVACVGENSYCETPGNTNDIHLSPNQMSLVEELAKTGKPIILILNEGRPRIVREIEPLCKGIIDVMLPSNYGGDALARLISGECNFSGKLPFTYPKWVNSVTTYDHKPSESLKKMEGAYDYSADIDVQWPFGFGLSYTTFEYSDVKINKERFNPEDELIVSVKVKNTGNREGMEAVILYSTDLVASITPDVLRVRGFDKISLMPGEQKEVSFKIPASQLAFVGKDGKWIIEEGDFEFFLGNQKVRARCDSTRTFDFP